MYALMSKLQVASTCSAEATEAGHPQSQQSAVLPAQEIAANAYQTVSGAESVDRWHGGGRENEQDRGGAAAAQRDSSGGERAGRPVVGCGDTERLKKESIGETPLSRRERAGG